MNIICKLYPLLTPLKRSVINAQKLVITFLISLRSYFNLLLQCIYYYSYTYTECAKHQEQHTSDSSCGLKLKSFPPFTSTVRVVTRDRTSLPRNIWVWHLQHMCGTDFTYVSRSSYHYSTSTVYLRSHYTVVACSYDQEQIKH